MLEALVLDKVLINDVVTATDDVDGVATALDDQEIDFNKFMQQNFAVSEATAKSISRSLSDLTSLSDAGLVQSQSYCDISYFGEDYVGVTRTF